MSDPIIRADSITGRRLDRPGFSRQYLLWLFDHGAQREPPQNLRTIRLDRFVYDLPSVRNPCAFAGGAKWRTTMRALFSLAAAEPGDDLDASRISATCYCRSGILTSGSDGRHRLLAQVLWGQLRYVGELYVHEEEQDALDEQLNRALLSIEEHFAAAGVRKNELCFDWNSGDDAKLVKQLVDCANPAEWRVLIDYLHHVPRNWQTGRPTWFRSRLQLLRDIREKPRRSIWHWGSRRRPATHGPEWAFEHWYARTLPGAVERWCRFLT